MQETVGNEITLLNHVSSSEQKIKSHVFLSFSLQLQRFQFIPLLLHTNRRGEKGVYKHACLIG